MAYDFYLFDPDRDAEGNIRQYHRKLSDNPTLVARFQREAAATTQPLEQAATAISAKIDGVNTRYDRTVVVPVAYGEESHKEPWLRKIAMHYGLGLASDGDLVLCYGDEDERFDIQTAWWEKSGASRLEILPDLEWLEFEAPHNQFFVLSLAGVKQNFIQCITDGTVNGRCAWEVQYREGGWERHFTLHVDTAKEVEQLMHQWMANDPAFKQHPWKKF